MKQVNDSVSVFTTTADPDLSLRYCKIITVLKVSYLYIVEKLTAKHSLHPKFIQMRVVYDPLNFT